MLWNRNYFLRFQFLLLKSYGSGSDFWKSSGSYFWKVPVPTFEKFRFWFQLFIKTIKSKFYKKNFGTFLPFCIVSCFTRKKFIILNKFIEKCEWNFFFNEGNQIHNFISSSGSEYWTSYSSGSTSQKVTVPTVPVPQHCQASKHLKNYIIIYEFEQTK